MSKRYILAFIMVLGFAAYACSANAAIFSISIYGPANNTWVQNPDPGFMYNATSTTNASFWCELWLNGARNYTQWANSGTMMSLNMAIPAQGNISWHIQCNDTGTAVESEGRIFFHDYTPPSVNITTPKNNTYQNVNTTVLYLNARDNIEVSLNYSIYVDYVLAIRGAALNNTATPVSVHNLTQGNHTLMVRVFDSATNQANATVNVYVDSIRPTAAIAYPGDHSWTSDSTPNISFIVNDPGASMLNYTIFIDNGSATMLGGFAPNNIPVEIILPTLAEGQHNIKVMARDTVNNTGNSTNILINIDLTQPNVIVLFPSNNTWLGASQKVNFTASDNMAGNMSYKLFIDSAEVQSGNLTNNSVISVPTSMSDGNHTFYVQAADYAMNPGTSFVYNVKIDNIAPSFVPVAPQNYTAASDTQVTLRYTSYDTGLQPVNHTIYVNSAIADSSLLAYSVTNNYTGTFADGSINNWSVVLRDAAGNLKVTGIYYFTVHDTTPLDVMPILSGVNDNDRDGNIELYWSPLGGAAYFRVYRSAAYISSAAALTPIGNTSGSSYEDTTSLNGTLYWYAITTLDSSLNENKTLVSSSFSATAFDNATPNSPTSLGVSATSDGSLSLSWIAVTQDVNGDADTRITYRIFRTTNISSLDTSAQTDIIANTTGTAYIDTGVVTGVNYTYVVTSVDDAGNNNSSITTDNIITMAPLPCSTAYSSWGTCSGGHQTRTRSCYGGGETTETRDCSSGSPGGGGSPSGTPVITDTQPTAVRTFDTVTEDKPAVMVISNEEIGVTAIELQVESEADNVQISVQKLTEQPKEVREEKSSKVYKYLKIEKKNLNATGVSAKVRFKVERSWLENNSVSEDAIVLKRFTTEWTELPTQKINSSEDYVYYEAETPGFSYFIIGTKRILVTSLNPTKDELSGIASQILDDSVVRERLESYLGVIDFDASKMASEGIVRDISVFKNLTATSAGTVVEIQLKNTGDKELSDIVLLEPIPKSVILNINEMRDVRPRPYDMVIEEDPIIQWRFNEVQTVAVAWSIKSLAPGEEQRFSYSVGSEIDADSHVSAIVIVPVKARAQASGAAVAETQAPEQQETPVVNDAKGDSRIALLGITVLALLAVAVFFIMRKRSMHKPAPKAPEPASPAPAAHHNAVNTNAVNAINQHADRHADARKKP